MRFIRLTLALAVSCVILDASSVEAFGYGLRVYGGVSNVSYGDFNEFADGINALIAADPTLTGSLDRIDWVPEVGAELALPIVPVLTLAIGAGILWGSSSYELTAGSTTLSFEHGITAYPITATLHANIALPFASTKAFVFAGGGAYYGTTSFEQRLSSGGSVAGYDADLSAWGFGGHGGAGISYRVAPTFRVEIGVQGRYAVIDGFEGTATSTDGETADVVLGFYEGEGGYMVYGPVRAVDAASVGRGEVDLSGYGFFLAAALAF